MNETFKLKDIKTQRIEWLKKELQKVFSIKNNKKLEKIDKHIDKYIDKHIDKQLEEDGEKEKNNININDKNNKNNELLIQFSSKLYEKGYSGLDIIQLLENHTQFLNLSNEKRYELLFAFNKVKKEFRNDKLIILFILNFLFISLDYSLENISFM